MGSDSRDGDLCLFDADLTDGIKQSGWVFQLSESDSARGIWEGRSQRDSYSELIIFLIWIINYN